MAERVTFPSTTGPMLAGLIDVPAGEVRGWGVFAHGFTLGKESPAAARICKGLAAEGVGMLRFDNLGLGDSDGDWGDGSFTHKVADTVRAAEFMNERGCPVDLLVGHSFGGSAVLAAADQVPGLRALVSIAAPVEPATSSTTTTPSSTGSSPRARPSGSSAVEHSRSAVRSSRTSAPPTSVSTSTTSAYRCW